MRNTRATASQHWNSGEAAVKDKGELSIWKITNKDELSTWCKFRCKAVRVAQGQTLRSASLPGEEPREVDVAGSRAPGGRPPGKSGLGARHVPGKG